MVDAYYDWLLEKIELYDNNGMSLLDIYSWALKRLFRTEFTCKDLVGYETGSYDADRCSDGLYLRELFSEEFEVSDDFWEGLIFSECSILELMIALSARMESGYLFDPEMGDRTPQWFWNMFESLGLMHFDNDSYDESEVDLILKRFVKRQYSASGEGSLFTFSGRDINARKSDIWRQMTHWINENFE